MEFIHARINPLNNGDSSSDALVKSDLSPLAIIAGQRFQPKLALQAVADRRDFAIRRGHDVIETALRSTWTTHNQTAFSKASTMPRRCNPFQERRSMHSEG
jgi:hypothetical protein